MERDQQFGPYQLVRKIASGGMAEIYLAKTGGIQGFEKFLVLKMIHPKWSQDKKFISMLVEEAKLAVALNHANIAQIFDLGQHGEVYYIAMEYVDGRDLFQVLVRTSESDTWLPFDVAAFVTEQVAAALHYAHTRCDARGQSLRLIHRDVSPQNIIISYNGEVKLIDFGIAKATMRPGETQVGIIKGKFYYMSPEQAWGQPLDHRTDIFSLGICLHETLTGQMLYAEDDQLLLLEKVRAAQIPRPSQLRAGIPPELDEITMKALAKDPAQRFQSGYELQRALTEYLHRRCPGFTPNRAARTMWDLFPQNVPVEAVQAEQKMTNREFSTQRPPDSVIFDLGKLPNGLPPRPAAPTPPPVAESLAASGAHQAGRRGPTRSVAVGQHAAPPSPRAADEGVFFGDSFGDSFNAKPGSHPPPPLSNSAPATPADSTRIVNWDSFKERHPARPGPSLEDTTNMRRDANGNLIAAKGSGVKLTAEAEGAFTADDARQGKKPAQALRPMKAPAAAPSAAAHERTTMFDPTAPLPGSSPEEAMPHERTTMFDPSKMGIAPPGPPEEAMPHERTTMFDPSKMAAPAPPPVDMAEEHTTMFNPATMLPPAAAPAAPAKPAPRAAPMKAAPERKAEPEAAPASREDKIAAAKARAKGEEKPAATPDDAAMSREEKIAAAKARAKGEGKPGAKADGDAAPMSREDKIAAAKARAQGGEDLKDKIKKKGADDAAPAEDKVAAAKARAQGGDDLKDKIKKKKPDGDAAPAAGDDARQAARAKALEKSGKGPAAPNIDRGAKGNAKSNMKVGNKPTILGFNAYSVISGLLAFIFLFLVISGYVAWQFFKPAEVIKLGTISVNSTPQGARISFDGTDLKATTPYDIDAVSSEGLHSVRVNLDGYVQAEKLDIKVLPGENTKVDFVLKPMPGTLVISSAPSEAQVLVLDEKTGEQTARCNTPCTIDDLEHVPEAFLQITLRKEGFKDEPVALKWSEEPQLTHHADLKPVEDAPPP